MVEKPALVIFLIVIINHGVVPGWLVMLALLRRRASRHHPLHVHPSYLLRQLLLQVLIPHRHGRHLHPGHLHVP